MKFQKIILVLASVFACSCTTSELEKKISQLQQENAVLRDSLRIVLNELDAYRYDPEKLCVDIDKFYKDGELDSLQNIFNILDKYHPESKESKKVTGYINKIKEQQAKEKEAAEKARLVAVNKLRKEYDEINDITWYYNPYFRHYNNANKISLYIGQTETNVWLRFKMSYTGEDWIFFDQAYLFCDGDTYQVYFDRYKDKESDNDSRVWEWIDVSVTSGLQSFLDKMVKGKNVKVRLTGKYTNTRKVSSAELKALKDVLLAYDVLKTEMEQKNKEKLENLDF